MGAIGDMFRGWQAAEQRIRRAIDQRDEAREALRAEKRYAAELDADAYELVKSLAEQLVTVTYLANARVSELEDEVERLQGELTIRDADARFHESIVEPPTDEAPW